MTVLEHKEYIRISGDATEAVLFIHGILGTPNHFAEFLPLVPETLSVYDMLLDGHGKGVKDFSKTSMKKWEAQVSSAVDDLSRTHERIYIVAHSLGTLLAIGEALKNKKICGLFLLAVPLGLSIKPRMIVNSLKVYFDRIRPGDREALAAKNCYGIEGSKDPLPYLGWIPRFLELFAKIRQTRKTVMLLDTPCFAYQSKRDEMVSRKSAACLKKVPCVRVTELAASGHYYYDDADRELLLAGFKGMLGLQ